MLTATINGGARFAIEAPPFQKRKSFALQLRDMFRLDSVANSRANASSPCQRSSTRSDILTIIYCPYSCVLPRERGNFSSLGTIRTADRTWSRLHYRLPLRDWLSRYRCVLRSITTSWCILVKRRIENIEEKKLDSGSGFCEEVLEFYRFYWITVQWSF